jgi:3-dehydroquinate synthase
MKDLVISTPSCKSVIYCGEGAFEERVKTLQNKKLFIVTDSNVNKLYGELISRYFGGVPKYVLPAGEKSKNYNQLLKILQAMINAGVTRSSTVVALGGGVVGDITGLAASLYMRGVGLVQIPTTLLSQVDSSVGGKTAVDFMSVKNIIGAFYQPSEVIVDPLFLATLPRRELRCGLGEIVKYGALDAGIYHKLLNNFNNLFDLSFMEDITYDCIAHKAKVVCEDEKDINGLRKTLNLGHTTGHALELYYKRKSHGEFVLIGMYYELYIAEKLNVCQKDYADSLRALIAKVIGKIPAYDDIDKAAGYAKFDKKNEQATTISIVVPHVEGSSKEIKLPLKEYVAAVCECRDKLKK